MRFDAPPLRASAEEPVQGRVSWKQRLFGGKISPPTQEQDGSDKREVSEYAWKIAAVEVRTPLLYASKSQLTRQATLRCYEVEGTGQHGIEDGMSLFSLPNHRTDQTHELRVRNVDMLWAELVIVKCTITNRQPMRPHRIVNERDYLVGNQRSPSPCPMSE
jgi:hypothetical protein